MACGEDCRAGARDLAQPDLAAQPCWVPEPHVSSSGSACLPGLCITALPPCTPTLSRPPALQEYHTDTHVRFVVTMPEERMREALAAGLLDKFKLRTRVSIGNMMLFNSEGVIQKYSTPEDVLREFFDLRLEHYAKRKALLLAVGGRGWGLWCGGVGWELPRRQACQPRG